MTQVLKLSKGEVKQLKVTGILKRNKAPFLKNGVMQYSYSITLQDRSGAGCNAEYISPDENITPFVPDVYQWIKCTWADAPFPPQIEPSDEPRVTQASGSPFTPPQPSMQVPPPPSPNPDQVDNFNGFAFPVGGKAIVFSMAWAKDILVAEIANKGNGYIATEDDIRRMIRNVGLINDAMMDYLRSY